MSVKYFIIVGKINNQVEELYGSFDRQDCVDELDCEKETWKSEGYKSIKITSRLTDETPDPDVYCNDDSYTKMVCNALTDPEVTVSVSDESEIDFDLEESRNMVEIIEACEATESPCISFFLNGKNIGNALVAVDYGDESIIDHSVNDFMESITKDL